MIASVTPHAYPKNAVNILNADFSKNSKESNENFFSSRFFRPFSDGDGYQWWLDRDGSYTALGTGGQYLMVSPEHDLVFVVTSKSRGLGQFFPAKLFHDHVLPSVQSEQPLPGDEVAQVRLIDLVGPPDDPKPAKPVPALPAIASAVSGVTYVLEDNPFNTDLLHFSFQSGQDHAQVSYTARES